MSKDSKKQVAYFLPETHTFAMLTRMLTQQIAFSKYYIPD